MAKTEMQSIKHATEINMFFNIFKISPPYALTY